MLSIVPPKQDGHNCGLVALCHTANYFQATFPDEVYQDIADTIKQQGGFTLINALFYLPLLLQDVEITFLVEIDSVFLEPPVERIRFIRSNGHETLEINPFQACLVAYRDNESAHIRFELDLHQINDNIAWAAFIHQK